MYAPYDVIDGPVDSIALDSSGGYRSSEFIEQTVNEPLMGWQNTCHGPLDGHQQVGV